MFSINLSHYEYFSLDNIAVQVPQANNASGMIGVSNTNSADHMPQGDYEDIDESKTVVPPHNIVFENSMHDYSRTPQPFEMSNYELPVQSTMSKVYIRPLHKQFIDDKKWTVIIGEAQIF